MNPDQLTSWRSQFSILKRCTYLISNSLGAMPRTVRDELERYARAWDESGVLAWDEGWWELAVDTGDLLAPILGVSPGSVSMHLNVSLATSLFLSCFDYPTARNRVVMTELEFPSVTYVVEGERQKGAEIITLPSPDGLRIPSQQLLAAIDERTRLVLLSHVLFKSAFVQDAAGVARRCREVGAVLLLDVYHSAGTLPLQLQDWGVHAAVGGCLKWLCGGPGAAYLWIEPELASELRPRVTGWQADSEPFQFRPGPIRYAEGAWRFLTGTPNVPALHSCRPGLEIIAGLGVEEIRKRSMLLTSLIIRAAELAGLEVRTPMETSQRGGTVSIWHQEAEDLCRRMIDQRVLCDYRPGVGVRLSPHFYNSEEECLQAVALMVELAERSEAD